MDSYIKKTIKAYDKNQNEFIKRTDLKNKIPYHAIKKMMKYLPKESILLDAGCAYGRDANIFSNNNYKVIGIDLSQKLLNEAKKRYKNIKFLKMDVRELKFPDQYFDGVWCNAVLFHLNNEDIKLALKEFYRVLKQDGILYTSYKKGIGSEEKLAFKTNYIRFFNYQTQESIEKLIKKSNLSTIERYEFNEKDTCWICEFAKK